MDRLPPAIGRRSQKNSFSVIVIQQPSGLHRLDQVIQTVESFRIAGQVSDEIEILERGILVASAQALDNIAKTLALESLRLSEGS